LATYWNLFIVVIRRFEFFFSSKFGELEPFFHEKSFELDEVTFSGLIFAE
jgi:hypothetical protein